MRIQVRFFRKDQKQAMNEIVLDCSAAALIPVVGDSVVDEEGEARRVISRKFDFSPPSGSRVDVFCE